MNFPNAVPQVQEFFRNIPGGCFVVSFFLERDIFGLSRKMVETRNWSGGNKTSSAKKPGQGLLVVFSGFLGVLAVLLREHHRFFGGSRSICCCESRGYYRKGWARVLRGMTRAVALPQRVRLYLLSVSSLRRIRRAPPPRNHIGPCLRWGKEGDRARVTWAIKGNQDAGEGARRGQLCLSKISGCDAPQHFHVSHGLDFV